MTKSFAIGIGAMLLCYLPFNAGAQSFVQRSGGRFMLDGQPYYYIGANYWYGGLLGLQKGGKKGLDRLRNELDFLRSKGVTNLRVLAGTEGSGRLNGVQRTSPPLQPAKGLFTADNLKGLDVLLHEMGQRNMKAVIFLSNNWEWSGGFLQYLNWNGQLPDSVMRRKLSWDEMRDNVSRFYSCASCMADYKKQVAFILNHTNTVSGKKYSDDPSIMAWELANEPRPMRPAANGAYKLWVSSTAGFIKSIDKKHLITLGTEGEMGTESMALYQEIHADKAVDYLTIHVWPKNWGWFSPATMEKDFPKVVSNTENYIQKHMVVAASLQKPLVIEEFGLPRDNHSFDVTSATGLRDAYYSRIFSLWATNAQTAGPLAGINFWAFGGTARPVKNQTFWKDGDDLMGDPPMEEQGLNSVFDSDTSTWKIIYAYTSTVKAPAKTTLLPSDKKATKETVALYSNLQKLLLKGVMFGHQDDLAYGVGWHYVEGKSDVKEVVGDYPAVYGWELGNLEHDLPYNLDSVPFTKMRQYVQEVYARGGVSTISWHGDNPVNGESAWDLTKGGVQSILPGGPLNELYKSWLNRVASFLQSLKGKAGETIPVLYRPFHELTGSWFWWGKNFCSPAEFKLLWRFTVDYLRNEKGLHQLLYVYNTAGEFSTEEEFMERYPGDDVVDLVSFDAYQYNDPQKDSSFLKSTDKHLAILEAVAAGRNKIPALAETGYERIPFAKWWTATLWPAIGQHKISYVLAWRNHGLQPNGNMHYYVPTKADVSSDDFKKFYNLDRTLFQKDVAKERLYQILLPE